MLAESLLLAVLGGAVGALAARWALPALLSLAPAGMPRLHEVRVDGAVLAFAAALTALTGLAFGLFPVWQSAHVDSSQILRSGRAGANAASRRPQKLLVVAEMTLAVVLLVGAGLLLRSFAKLLGEEPGFDPDGVATALVALPSARYSTPEAVGQFFERLRRSLEESPGITSAAMCNNPPLSGWRNDDLLTIEGYTPPGDQPPDEESRAVSPGYFRTLRIAVLRGREFDEKDDAQHPPVAIVSQSMASKYWGNQDPVGRRMGLVDDRGALQRWMTIVGVVGDVKQTSLADPVVPTFYRPHVQATWNSMMVVVRSAGGDSRLPLAAIRSRLRELDREQALFEARPMNDIVDESLSAQQFNLRLLGLFAVLAVALAGTGIYGVMRYIVGQRTSEIGLRMALGATQRQVLAQVLREGLTLAAVGLALGLGASVLLTRTMEALSGLLYGVTATDPLTLAAVIAMLAAVAVLACWAPARKATGVDPIVALREE
jgi:predicted permease